jgi:renalase
MIQPDEVMPARQRRTDILIVGAGMAGLIAAAELRQTAHTVLIVEKSRGVGGRLASRRIGGATFDHGAQFMTVRDPRFAAVMDHWLKIGIVAEWPRGSADGHPRWRGHPAMTAIAQHLARSTAVILEQRLVALRCHQSHWIAVLEGGETLLASAVVLTPPVPQSLALLDAGEVHLPSATRTRLERIEYERCLAVMAVLDGPAKLPLPGGLALDKGPIAWLADNQMKGVSSTPAVTLHATAAFSLEQWDRDRQDSGQELLRAAEPWLGSAVTEFQVHGWRYSKPVQIEPNPCLILSQSPPLLLAGDAFAGPRVEAAAVSGWAAADTLKRMRLTPCSV